MSEQHPASGLPKLLPLAYCRPARAAALLKCYVEDIYHWAAIGAIRLYVMADKADFKDGAQLPFLLTPTGDFDAGQLKHGASFEIDPDSPVTHSEELGSPSAPFKYYGKDWDGNYATLSGFWFLPRWYWKQWEAFGYINPCSDIDPEGILGDSYELHAFYGDEPYTVTAIGVEFPDIMNNLWLMREDLVKLERHIRLEIPFDAVESELERRDDPMPVPQPKPSNPQLRAIYLLSQLACNTDDELKAGNRLSAEKQLDIISARLASALPSQFPVKARRFRTWLEQGEKSVADT